MQKDMHYSALYVLGRLAGIKKYESFRIAAASELVDESRQSKLLKIPTGHRIDVVTTSHAAVNVKNVLATEQRYIWVPFHFIPGNEGTSENERFMCRKDSQISKEIMEHFFVDYYQEKFGLSYLGIAFHIYMDTFSHYGFSGLKSEANHIKNESIIILNEEEIYKRYKALYNHPKGARRFFSKLGYLMGDKIESVSELMGEKTGAIGHSAAGHLPDFPYVSWQYSYQFKGEIREVVRHNSLDFLEACEKVFALLKRVRDVRPDIFEESIIKDFTEISKDVSEILQTPGRRGVRIKLWQRLLEKYSNLLEEVDWKPVPLKEKVELFAEELKGKDLGEHPRYQFYQAAHLTQVYILRNVLPKYKLFAI
ncbi:MAG: hypothetical protein NTX05_07415 [Fusobacteria bacterium]|nr:hypothetical protein [Fusobacteriota bacterium]